MYGVDVTMSAGCATGRVLHADVAPADAVERHRLEIRGAAAATARAIAIRARALAGIADGRDRGHAVDRGGVADGIRAVARAITRRIRTRRRMTTTCGDERDDDEPVHARQPSDGPIARSK
jgi:DNA-binding IclR family transcriptional regulator